MYELTKEETQQADMFLEWFNDFISIEAFARYHKLTNAQAIKLLHQGKEMHKLRIEK